MILIILYIFNKFKHENFKKIKLRDNKIIKMVQS